MTPKLSISIYFANMIAYLFQGNFVAEDDDDDDARS